MKKQLLNLAIVALSFVSMTLGFSSCEETKKNVQTTTSDGVYYKGSATPFTAEEAKGKFSAGIVDDGLDKPGIARSGYWATFAYLKAGELKFSKASFGAVTDYGATDKKTITYAADGAASGARVTGKNDDNFKSCTQDRYTWTSGGAAITISSEGLYFLAIDETSKQVIVMQISRVGVVGSGTSVGWNANDIQLTASGTPTNDGGSWSATQQSFKSADAYKFRFNNGWGDSLTMTDGKIVKLQCNLGKTASALELGGINLVTDAGKPFKATITLTWTGGLSFSSAFSGKVEDAVTNFDATKNVYSVVGAAIGGWDQDSVIPFVSSASGVNTYSGTVTFTVKGEFKFRKNEKWEGGDFAYNDSKLTISGANAADFQQASSGTDFALASGVTVPVTYTLTLKVTQTYNEVAPTKYELTVVKK